MPEEARQEPAANRPFHEVRHRNIRATIWRKGLSTTSSFWRSRLRWSYPDHRATRPDGEISATSSAVVESAAAPREAMIVTRATDDAQLLMRGPGDRNLLGTRNPCGGFVAFGIALVLGGANLESP
jgi:hypothetical protein